MLAGYSGPSSGGNVDFYLVSTNLTGNSGCNQINITATVINQSPSVTTPAGTSSVLPSVTSPPPVVNNPPTISSTICFTALSIELLDFKGECINGTPQLNWITASEINNDYFTIERSSNGIHFEAIGTVDGADNSPATLNYEFVDATPLPPQEESGSGVGYYRLKQTDFDGKFEYIGPITVEYCSKSFQQLALYPNHANDKLFIEISSPKDAGLAVLQITDLLGRTIRTEKLNIQKGNNIHKISVEEFSSGMYFFSLVKDEIITLPVRQEGKIIDFPRSSAA